MKTIASFIFDNIHFTVEINSLYYYRVSIIAEDRCVYHKKLMPGIRNRVLSCLLYQNKKEYNFLIYITKKILYRYEINISVNDTCVYGNENRIEILKKDIELRKREYEKDKNMYFIFRYFKYGYLFGIAYGVLSTMADIFTNDVNIIGSLIKALIFGFIMGMLSWQSIENEYKK